MHLTDYDGTLKNHFQIGLGEGAAKLTKQDERLIISLPLQITNPDGTPVTPTQDTDAITLGFFIERLNQNFTDSKNYINGLLKELFEEGVTPPTGGDDPEPTPTPNPGILGNVMLPPTEITGVNDDDKVSLGILPRTKYFDRVSFEVKEQFQFNDGRKYEVAIGTEESPTQFLPWINLKDMDRSSSLDVVQTIDVDTEIFAHIRWVRPSEDEPEPEFEYTPRLINERDRVTGEIRMDASKRVIQVTIHSDNPGDNDVEDTDLFGTEILGKGYMDFAINMPMEYGKRYRILQINPALSEYGDDPNVQLTDAGWAKEKIYELEKEGEELLYAFLLGRSTGDNDFIHIWIYDADDTAEHPEALYAFHVKNEIEMHVNAAAAISLAYAEIYETQYMEFKFSGEDEAMMQPFTGASNGNVESTHWILCGELHDHSIDLADSSLTVDGVPVAKLECTIYGVKAGEQYQVKVVNPYFNRFATKQWVMRDETTGKRYISMTLTAEEDGTIGFSFPVSGDNSYDIIVTVEGPHGVYLNSFSNRLIFLPGTLVYGEVGANDGIMTLAEGEEITPVGNKGRIRIRILSF